MMNFEWKYVRNAIGLFSFNIQNLKFNIKAKQA